MHRWVIYYAGRSCLSEDSSVPANGRRKLPVFLNPQFVPVSRRWLVHLRPDLSFLQAIATAMSLSPARRPDPIGRRHHPPSRNNLQVFLNQQIVPVSRRWLVQLRRDLSFLRAIATAMSLSPARRPDPTGRRHHPPSRNNLQVFLNQQIVLIDMCAADFAVGAPR
jgi:hypothetical protein